MGSVLPGWRFKQERFETTVYFGLDLQNHQFFPDDPVNALRGTHVGARFAADVWLEPTDIMMVSTAFSVSTIKSGYWGRAQFGGQIPGLGWIGPEAQVFSDLTYRQYSVGLHLTGFKTAEFEWSLGAGYVRDTDHRDGPYGRIGLNCQEMSAAQSSVRRKRVTAIVIAISIRPASASVSNRRSESVAPLSMIARTIRR